MSKNNDDYLNNLRHSCAHLLAAAVMELWPKTKHTIGPPIENGFYYDFDFGNVKISDTDLPKIERKMTDLVSQWEGFHKIVISQKDAIARFCDNPYKIELINEFVSRKENLTLYKSGNFIDLCRGGHCQQPNKELKYFKILKIAGAYWRGSEKNKMLTRIYGTCFPTKEELEHYLWQLEEAKKRDHRKLGKELDLFIIPEELGPGLLIWMPKGATVRREIEKFIISEQIKRGYQHVYSPHIGKKSLWKTSGHWDLYRDKMYSPIKIDQDEYLVKPMNCPMHMMVYKSHQRSYRELPMRIAENATVYRYEQAGELSGMTRVRYITQDDSHIFCTREQVIDEFIGVLDYTVFLMKTFKISDYSFRLSLRDPQNKDKYLGSDSVWIEAEKKIEAAVKKVKIKYEKKEGEAAFYGPKLDIMIKDALNREWQCGTIQIDFMLPDRFKLEYIDQRGKLQQPVLIHRAPLGSLERFVGILIEHFAGKFPLWLAPVQVKVIPIVDRHKEYAEKVAKFLTASNIRSEVDSRNESMQGKIRDAALQKVPYMGIIGDREINQLSNKPITQLDKLDKEKIFISVRTREGKDLGQINLKEFISKLLQEIEKKY